MSEPPTLSAVAQRKADKLCSVSTSDAPQTPSVGEASSRVVSILSLPVKRKASAQSQVRSSRNPPLESQFRKKKHKAIGPPELPTTIKVPNLSPQRTYSPSRPLSPSSIECDECDVKSPPVELEILESTEYSHWNGVYDSPSRVQKIPFMNFNLVNEQNYFTINAEHAFSITNSPGTAKILLLNRDDSFLFVGTMRLTLVQGSIRLFGVSLFPSTASHQVFAPRTHPVPVLEVLNEDYQMPVQSSLETNPNTSPLLQRLPEYVRKVISTTHTVIIVQELRTGVEGLGRIIQPFANVFEPDIREACFTEQILKGSYIFKAESQFDTIFQFSDDWESAIEGILSPTSGKIPNTSDGQANEAPIILVKGPKNSGKSTFSRTLANCLTNTYRRVAFIECDLGQSEFTPGGMVSLNVISFPVLSPPFTHLSQPDHAHFIGDNSPKTSPSHYLSALSDLAQRYQLEIRYATRFDDSFTDGKQGSRDSTTIPLVINTQGWVKGMGADLLRSIEEIFEPTHIVEFQSPPFSEIDALSTRSIPTMNQTDQRPCNTSTRIFKLPPILPPARPPRYSAADLRSLSLASYFYARFPTSKRDDDDSGGLVTHWDTSLSLRSIAPLVIDIRAALESIVIIAPTGDDVVPGELSRALVCGVVGLVVLDSPSSPPDVAYIQGALPPAPQNSRCVGLGFIRGASDTHLQLLTPTPVCELRFCRTIVLGGLSMPVWAFLELDGNDTEESGVPFLQWGRSVAEDAGGERRRIRRNIMRRGQM